MPQATPTRRRGALWRVAVLAAAAGACGGSVTDDPEILARLPETVDFNHHVKPLLADRCYACHGPDENARKAQLRLDVADGALETRLQSGGRAVVPGSLGRSQVWRRITSEDDDERMPPGDSNLHLSEYERALIGRWIEQGAEWKPHWAFIPPERPELPEVRDEGWVRNPVDRFVLARLEREGLSPSPEADKERLLRRVSFDLTGLPPTLEEINAFLANKSADADVSDAYEAVVDRLIASPAYGERMALDWMDLSRYADSHGLHADGYRYMWPWRDWVIASFNENQPHDEFLTWQFAGDLLPDATREQILATAFHRNHPMTAEGGVIDEEFRLEYVFDRAETTAQGLMGLTLECARCHDHKFDPLSQKEFYEFSAFFNNVDELGMTGDDGNAGPLLPLPEPDVEAELEEVRALIARLESELDARRSRVTTAHLSAASLRGVDPRAGLVAHYPLDRTYEETAEVEAGKEPRQDTWTPNAARSRSPARVRGVVELVDGPRGRAVAFDNEYDSVDLEGTGLFERTEPYSLAFWVRPTSDEPYRVIMGNAGHKNSWWRGHELFLDGEDRLSVRLIHAFPHNYIHVRTRESLARGQWTHVAFTYDGSSRATGMRVYTNGRRAELSVEHDRLYKSAWPIDDHHERARPALRVGRSYRSFSGENGYFTGAVDDIRVYDRRLSAADVRALAAEEGGAALVEMASRSPESWTEDEVELARDHHVHERDREYRRIVAELRPLREREHELVESVPEVMVMEERDEPRPLHVLSRGTYDAPGEEVSPGTPRSVLPFPEDLPPNRLGLVRWLVRPDHPLTARVTVNRYWQLYFGTGLVRTPEDFGYQGALPTHPELLDWLAVEFMESGWDVKAFQRLIVTSATYRQASHATPQALERDPENALLARGPRYRLPAEMIRDGALAASGLLVEKVGGPSVRPYQPPGLWREKGVFSRMLLDYEPDQGEGLYRRSMYTFIKRTSPPPAMVAFDAPSRSDCVVRRQTTNTPLQALVLLNDPQYVEASRKLAERMIREGGDTLEDRLRHGFRLATSRHPRPDEIQVLSGLHAEERSRFGKEPARAEALLAVGDAPWDRSLDRREVAALAVVASMMLNHDEAYTKR